MNLKSFALAALASAMLLACNNTAEETTETTSTDAATASGQAMVTDNDSQKDIVKVAVGSQDHTTLVKALQAADLVNSLANAGPFTVFAPTNAAFDKLPEGTVEGLLEADKKADLQNILEYHVTVGVFKPEMLRDGQTLGQVNGKNVTIANKDGKITVNGTANIIATIPATNGIIHVVDGVLLPK